MSSIRTALIGAGFISNVHAEALRAGVPGAEIVAIVDRNLVAAEALAKRWGIAHAFGDIEELIAAEIADVAHVMVPPDAHSAVTRRLLEAGLHVFLEKPMATASVDCDALAMLAAERGRVLGVNQNFVFHPTYREAKRLLLDERRLGPVRSVHVTFNVPLRQLGARQFGHWMFRKPANILLEQAVHPLSQMVDLLGLPTRIVGRPVGSLALGDGQVFHDRWMADFAFGDSVGQLYLAFGQTFHSWKLTAICDDGVLIADMSAGRVLVQGRAQWPEFADNLVTGAGMAARLVGQSVTGALGYITGLLKLRPKSDGFFVSMRDSIAAYYRGLPEGKAPLDGAFGGALVRVCETLAASVPEPSAARPAPLKAPIAPELVIFGGTGFIGSHLIRRLVAEGRPVRVVSRAADAQLSPFNAPNVEIMQGNVANRADVVRALAGAKRVVNLAHGGGGNDWGEIKRTMVDSALLVAECAVAAGVERLVHVGSIASLYLGNPAEKITGETPPDPQSDERALYARGKAEVDRGLVRFAADHNLGLVILRPGLVVGQGTAALHGGLGFFNNEQHVIGWNDGTNPLPFVLVEDVADAIVRAVDAPAAAGKSYNLVGGVRPTAMEFVSLLSAATGRPLRFHPQSTDWLYASELFKWVVKRATGRSVDMPSRRDLLSRGLRAQFDCSDVERDLEWKPVVDRAVFLTRAVDIHRAPFERIASLAK